MSEPVYFIGVDVGTGSVRAGLFDSRGRMLSSSSKEITLFRPADDHVEQSSTEIWQFTCDVVRAALKDAGVNAAEVAGIGFDATCSLVALDSDDRPVSLSTSGEDNQNVIVWMDHRATGQAQRINQTGSKVLDYVGGTISPEMEVPKLLWIKENLPDAWQRTRLFFDLPDFLVYRACGEDIRSSCSKACKWTYLAHEEEGQRWHMPFFHEIGLEDLFDHHRVGRRVAAPGERAGNLSDRAAAELGLTNRCAVAVSLIDAHAGGIGVTGADAEHTLAVIAGTSSCHMASSPHERFVPGVWGPYYNAMVPGMWLSEGGQSAAGALIDHVIESSAEYAGLKAEADQNGTTVYDLLNETVYRLEKDGELTADFHLLGYYHGNRSPRADPSLKGMISGLSLSHNARNELARAYLAAIQSVAYGTRHIIDEMNRAGHKIERIHMCGGLTKNAVWMREHADACQLDIHLAAESEAVLLGSAMLGATAAGHFDNLPAAMAGMGKTATTIKPDPKRAEFHRRKYRVFLEMHTHQLRYREIMDGKDE